MLLLHTHGLIQMSKYLILNPFRSNRTIAIRHYLPPSTWFGFFLRQSWRQVNHTLKKQRIYVLFGERIFFKSCYSDCGNPWFYWKSRVFCYLVISLHKAFSQQSSNNLPTLFLRRQPNQVILPSLPHLFLMQVHWIFHLEQSLCYSRDTFGIRFPCVL